jgi:hypothetical protein
MFNPQPFKKTTSSILFYVLAALSPVQPLKGPFDNRDRVTPLGILAMTPQGYASYFGPSYWAKCKITKEDYFDLKEVDSRFITSLRWSFDLKEYEIKAMTEEYDVLKDICLSYIKEDKVMTLKDIEKHIPFLKKIKDYTVQLHGADSVAEWVV